MIFLLTQTEVAQYRSVKEEVKAHVDKINWDVGILKSECAEYKRKSARAQEELNKVCESRAS